jgi:hypothetical protein
LRLLPRLGLFRTIDAGQVRGPRARGESGTPIALCPARLELALFVPHPHPSPHGPRPTIGFVFPRPLVGPMCHNSFSAEHLYFICTGAQLALFRTFRPHRDGRPVCVGLAFLPGIGFVWHSRSREGPGARREGRTRCVPLAGSRLGSLHTSNSAPQMSP